MSYIKQTRIAAAVAVTLLASSWGAFAASDSATINITATVVDNTCTPDWPASVPVDLGRAALRDFTGVGVVGQVTPLT